MHVWQDREIRFDSPDSHLRPRAGEFKIDLLDAVEDTKGNNGDRGKLLVTNLRIMWVSSSRPRVNLSIGYNAITNISTKRTFSKLRGAAEALYILTKISKTQFEFIFTNLSEEGPRLFSTVMAVHRAYETSRLYRELRLRSAVVRNKELQLLPLEEVYSKFTGVWNLSSDQGNLGTLHITNVRLVWHCNLNESFNISLPYLQIKLVTIRDSKFGMAMVLETTPQSSGLILGFRVDPFEKLKQIVQEVRSLSQVFTAAPIFGVEYKVEESPREHRREGEGEGEGEGGGEGGGVRGEEDLEGTEESTGQHQDTLAAAYFADPHKATDGEPVFNPELGLAVERLPPGFSLQDLWGIV